MLKHLTKSCDINEKRNVIFRVPLMPILIFPMTLSHCDLPNKKQKKCNNQREVTVLMHIYWTLSRRKLWCDVFHKVCGSTMHPLISREIKVQTHKT